MMATNERYGECVLWQSQRVVRSELSGSCESMKVQVRGYVRLKGP
jgi:hypothetical protein